MPLPKPSKMISKRFKKPKPLLSLPPPRDAPFHALPSQKHHSFIPRELRVRVICTDPDATDDSSSDEDEESALHLQGIAHKRLVREIWLPSPSSPDLQARDEANRCEGSPVMKRANQHASSGSRGGPNYWRNGKLSGGQHMRSSKMHKEVRCSEEEEHHGFLSGFTEDYDLWDIDLHYPSRPQREKSCAEMLDLELDAEVLSWIDSLQRLP